MSAWVYPRFVARTTAEAVTPIATPEVPYQWVANVRAETRLIVPWPPGGVTGALIKSALGPLGLPRPRLR